ncbi:transposase [Shimia sp. MMG029]|uniref:transposase n=1 Tax=Shimia sp. MMG029 TaxID=3021978 RepID=UPI003F8EBD77
MDACWVIHGTMARVTFDTVVETQLAPTLSKGDVIILDNLSSHKSVRAAEVLRDVGVWLLLLPPYCLNLNPIEIA